MPGSKIELERLLDERNEHPETLAEIDRRVYEQFSETHAIFVLDMSGFSRLSLRHGIVHFLAMIRRLQSIALPLIARHGGHLVKTEADNIFAVFPEVDRAVSAALTLQDHLSVVNSALPEDWDLYACIGIGYGEVLMIQGEDMFGNEMNLASKLGEDIAESGEVLLTATAFEHLTLDKVSNDRRIMDLSGLEQPYYVISWA